MDEKVLNKISKLLALGEGQANQEEADWSAYGKGRADGKDINLNKQVQRQALPQAV